MFGILKQKISDFIGRLTKKEEEKPPEIQEQTLQAPVPVQLAEIAEEPRAKELEQTKAESQFTQPASVQKQPVGPPKESRKEPEQKKEHHAPVVQKPLEEKPKESPKVTEQKRLEQQESAVQKQFEEKPKESPKAARQERKLEPRLGLASRVKSLFTSEVEIKEAEVAPLLDELQWAMLESDVSLDTAEYITRQLKESLVGRKMEKGKLREKVRESVKNALSETFSAQSFDLLDYVRSREKPVKILFLGPNGCGKTTTIAKLAFYLRKQGVSSVLAASDTFRAAAIEQLSHHGQNLGVNVVRHKYGSDPSAVAFDAIAHAKARGIDCVLIDTAGRQETNYNLLKEMEKINRVVKPDLKIFVGEALAGHSIVEQAKAFHQALKLDGIILTKLDCDAKGGTSFSLAHELRVPLLFLGAGQGYEDLKPFDANWIVNNVLAE